MSKPLINCHCLGVVLSGGKSSRMGKDKSLLTRNNEDMLSFSTQQLHNAGASEVVVSGQQHGIADTIENVGPMGGIFTIIEKYQPQALLILPVDLPLIDDETLRQLKRVGELSNQACFYQDNFLPLYLPINAHVEQFFRQSFSQLTLDVKGAKGPSIKALLKQIPSKALMAKNKQRLFNANTPEQWQQAKQQFQPQHIKHRNIHV